MAWLRHFSVGLCPSVALIRTLVASFLALPLFFTKKTNQRCAAHLISAFTIVRSGSGFPPVETSFTCGISEFLNEDRNKVAHTTSPKRKSFFIVDLTFVGGKNSLE